MTYKKYFPPVEGNPYRKYGFYYAENSNGLFFRLEHENAWQQVTTTTSPNERAFEQHVDRIVRESRSL